MQLLQLCMYEGIFITSVQVNYLLIQALCALNFCLKSHLDFWPQATNFYSKDLSLFTMRTQIPHRNV